MPRTLNTEPNLDAPDDFYAALVDAQRGLTPAQSQQVNARLVLLLANHIGDARVLEQALARARQGILPAGADETLRVTQ
ncbi:Hypothetical protein RADP37_01185 [Roseomonas mucosa]|uniref:DUF2783 domain-containing protein n=1 Tax=Roseomonas mucosa TaxID=207340 RepID=A0A4Y1MVT2_9PROT|nr:DUF2783 domain-containing protein [Roseomonas mucosa]AWV22078.1 Hypothetical protein RADP37_01185 [Roseomonas mucosa]MDT8275165.1 DUF2783 domain-containing protein [Roseomonas mucosa]MDT8355650.1 DUF2783 domain-containing protein [Roseomonas mucosa]MDU7520057.1 DUF2783 domain-containing protein [Roseomonas mucosa]